MREQHKPIYHFLLEHAYEDDLRERVQAFAAEGRIDLDVVLNEAEADNNESGFFERLYKAIGSEERYLADVRRLITTGKADKNTSIANRIYWRRSHLAEISDELLATWYLRYPADRNTLQHYLTYDGYRETIRTESGNLPKFRAVVQEHDKSHYVNEQLFRRYATQTEWETAVNILLKKIKPGENAKFLSSQLERIHPERDDAELPRDLQDQLIKKFGDEALQYLNYFVDWRFRAMVEETIAKYPNNNRLLDAMRQIQSKNWQQFNKQFCTWSKLLYARDAAYFGRFIAETSGYGRSRDHACIRELADWARRDGHRDLFNKLAARLDDRAYWNADLREVLSRPNLPNATLSQEMERLDVRRSGIWVYKVFIDDDNAAALYSRKPDAWREYVWRYLVEAESGGYRMLLQAARDARDDEFYIRVFRRVATQESWNAEMERLYARDLPADQILAELEKRKPTDVYKIAPGVIHKFLTRYGDAVMPFFENYIDWTTPERLTALLDLPIERGDLLRELQAIARRQPIEFGDQAAVWAVRLYEMSPTFFVRFIARYLTRGSEKVGREMLRRFEADGHHEVFQELFPRLYWGNDWDKEIKHLIETVADDEQLLATVQRRITRWMRLSDDIATTLYKRNWQLFRVFIIEHVESQSTWWRYNEYDDLKKAANKRNDTDLVKLLVTSRQDEKHQAISIRNLVEKKDLSWAELDARARQISTDGVFHNANADYILMLLKRYGDEMMPALLQRAESYYWGSNYPDVRKVRELVSEANYWHYVFARRENGLWVGALKDLADAEISDEEFAVRLTMLTPQTPIGTLPDHIAEGLYRRAPSLARPFVERFLDNTYYNGLFELAGKQGDADLQDYLTALALLHTDKSIQSAQYQAKRDYKDGLSDEDTKKYAGYTQMYRDRLAALYAESPAQYVNHAAAVLRHIRPGREGLSAATLPYNPLWQALVLDHAADWQRDPAAIRDLLESPNFVVQIAALNILSDGSAESAARVVENLRSFRVLLLSNTFKDTKRLALACLEGAGRNGEPTLAPVLELLQTVVDYTVPRRAISDEVAVTIARLMSAQVEA
jgi:hypothetical protein